MTESLQKKVWHVTMAGSKKKVKIAKNPAGNHIVQGGNPDYYYLKYPAWNFSNCDMEHWSIFSEDVRKIFWDEILPHLQAWETQTWGNILINSKKQNHSIDTKGLNKTASDRLADLYIEGESLISLRLRGNHRIYGYMNRDVFHILWIDLNHGDNAGCVCRSYKKHT